MIWFLAWLLPRPYNYAVLTVLGMITGCAYEGRFAVVDRIVPLKGGDFTVYCKRPRQKRKPKDVNPEKGGIGE